MKNDKFIGINIIEEHILAYENAGKIPPPFRITKEELKSIFKEIKTLLFKVNTKNEIEEFKYYNLRSWKGCELEIVEIINREEIKE